MRHLLSPGPSAHYVQGLPVLVLCIRADKRVHATVVKEQYELKIFDFTYRMVIVFEHLDSKN